MRNRLQVRTVATKCWGEDDGVQFVSTDKGTRAPFAPWKQASISANVPTDRKSTDRCTAEFLQVFATPLLDIDDCFVMSNCAHNVFESLHKRYLKDTNSGIRPINKRLLDRIITRVARDIGKRLSVPTYPLQEFLMSKKGQLGRRYNKAVGQLIKQGYDAKRNSAITMFVKKEKYYDSTKSPRMIMGRDPRFNILYGPIVSLLEKAFFELPQVCNACDFKECGNKFTKLWAHTHLIYENDMSKYEATQTFELLKIEYLVNYNAMLLANFPKDMLNAYTTCFATKIVKVCHSVTLSLIHI